jgi:hypothetical protein
MWERMELDTTNSIRTRVHKELLGRQRAGSLGGFILFGRWKGLKGHARKEVVTQHALSRIVGDEKITTTSRLSLNDSGISRTRNKFTLLLCISNEQGLDTRATKQIVMQHVIAIRVRAV